VLDANGRIKEEMTSVTVPLALFPETSFPPAREVALIPGDQVVLMTDGVLEAESPDGDVFGSERAIEVVRGQRHQPARQIAEALHQAVCRHVQDAALADDLTVVVIKAV
jgi:sigma-B regulation protein RsbU (phosphoserine phosphatase)